MATNLDLAIAEILRNGSADAKIGVLTGMGEIAMAREYADKVDAVDRAQYHLNRHPTRPTTDADRANSLFDLGVTVPADQVEYNRLWTAHGEALAAVAEMTERLREMADDVTADHDYAPA